MAEIDHSEGDGGSGFKVLFKIAYGVARKKGLKHEDAEEVANTTIAIISKRRPDMESSEELVPLTYKIANDETATLMRREHAQKRDRRMTKPSLDIVENMPDSETGPVENLEKKELGEKVRGMLRKLSERDEAVIKDKYFRDLSFKEISEKRSIPIGSVGVIIMRALRVLRELGGDPEAPLESAY